MSIFHFVITKSGFIKNLPYVLFFVKKKFRICEVRLESWQSWTVGEVGKSARLESRRGWKVGEVGKSARLESW
jgi:hypothetical protein